MSAASGGTTAVGPKRVVFCLGNLGIGGTELNAVRTAERLDRERFELHAVTLQEDGPLRERYEAAGVPLHPLPLESLHHPTTLRRGQELARLLRALDADVFHSHDIYSNVFGVPCARAAGVSRVIASRRWLSDSMPHPAHNVANRLSYRLAHRVLANSPTVAALVSEEDGIPANRVRMVPNFLEEAAFEDPGDEIRRGFREALGIPEDAPVVGTLANLQPAKDHPTLLRALQATFERQAGVRAVLAGEGPSRERLERLATDLGIADRVYFAGRLPHRPNPHFLFDVSVLTSRSEAFPNSLIEAMAAGRPPVATRVGGVPDAVDHGRTGLLVPVGDVEAIAAAIESLMADLDGAKRMGAAARAAARERFAAGPALETLSRLYEGETESVTAPARDRAAGLRPRGSELRGSRP